MPDKLYRVTSFSFILTPVFQIRFCVQFTLALRSGLQLCRRPLRLRACPLAAGDLEGLGERSASLGFCEYPDQ